MMAEVGHNLIEDPWIPVRRDGRSKLVSLRTALLDSHQIDGLALAPATLMVAVLRQTLLPLVLDALGHPQDARSWRARRLKGALGCESLEVYLEKHRPRFDLFDEVAPFAQVAGLVTASSETKPASLLVPSMPTGNNVPLFGARTEADPPALRWPDAAAWLLHTQCWDTAGIKSGALGDPRVKNGKTTGNPTGPVGSLGVIVPTGPTLFETLLLNLPIIPADPRGPHTAPEDRPQWARPPTGPTWEQRPAKGVLDLLTWQARRVRLVPSLDGRTGETVVREVVVAAGDRLLSVPQDEPHTAWSKVAKPKPGDPPYRPSRHRSGRAFWRGLDGLLAAGASSGAGASVEPSVLLRQIGALQADGALEDDYALGVEVVGVEYGTQSAVVENVIHDAIPLPVTALAADSSVGEAVLRLATDTDELVKAMDELEQHLCRSLGGESAPWDRGERASERLVHRLDGIARRFLAGLQREPWKVDEAVTAWAVQARAAALETADELLSQLPPSAIVGREKQEHGQRRAYRAPLAELRFRDRLRRALPDAENYKAGISEREPEGVA
jgi:CRISPR system Cascade subunit CasA